MLVSLQLNPIFMVCRAAVRNKTRLLSRLTRETEGSRSRASVNKALNRSNKASLSHGFTAALENKTILQEGVALFDSANALYRAHQRVAWPTLGAFIESERARQD